VIRIGILALVLGAIIGAPGAFAQAPGPTVVPLTAITADDGTLDLSGYLGRVVYLDFWASWCRPCRGSFAWMADMHAVYADRGLVIVAVNVDRDGEKARRFLEREATPFGVVFDPDATLARELALEAMPSSFLYGADGIRRLSHTGFRDGDTEELERAIAAALKEAQK